MNYARNTNLKEKKKEKEKNETPNFTIGVLTFFSFDVSLVPLANKSLFIKHMPPFLTLEVLPLLPSESGGRGGHNGNYGLFQILHNAPFYK